MQLFLTNPVVDEYDEGIWHVVKYANGQAEMYGAVSKTESTDRPSGPLYYTSTAINLPKVFIASPVVNITCNGNLGGYVYAYSVTSTQVGIYLLTEAQRSNIPVNYMTIAKGKWK